MVDCVLLDIAGVLTGGGKALPGALDAVARLRRAGLPVRFLTNTTRQPRRRLLADLRALGFAVEAEELLTPAKAACDWLAAHDHSPHLLIHPDLAEDFAGCPKGAPPAVIIGDAAQGFSYDALNAAFRAVEAGAPLLALARNRVFRDADGQLSLDSGAFVAALEYATGRDAQLFGKPAPGFFAAALAGIGCAPEAAAMIGDDAEADVAGALAAGIGTAILVRTGKYRPGDESRVSPRPSAVAADIGAAVAGLPGLAG